MKRRADASNVHHKCHAEGCKTKVPPALLMCKPHWGMVAPSIQQRVWDTYVPGQEVTKRVSVAYLRAAQDAIECVASKEGRRGGQESG